MFPTTNIERTPLSMRSRMTKGRTERRILVAGRWERVPQQKSLMEVFGRSALAHVNDAQIRRYQEATSLRSLLS